jgi:hypothetical protein
MDRELFKRRFFFQEIAHKTEAYFKGGNFSHKALLILEKTTSHPSNEELILGGI